MFDRPDFGNRALLVHVELADDELANDVDEFVELARSAGLSVAGLVRAKRSRPVARTFIGRGKIDEIRLSLQSDEIDVVLFAQTLSPSQERNLEREWSVRVLDRTSLILDIFAQRARTFEGKLQVELAQLSHLSTRLVRGWTHLERQKGGIGLRGPGETQLETDRRLLGHRVRTLKGRLDKVRRQREQGRSQRGRSGVPTVALVGYTNAGKSTLFNRLTDASVFQADQLFATLDPTLRKMALPNGVNVVLADTVGFVRALPHELVDAFRSTLTETLEADLLLHVIDDSDVQRDERMADVDRVLSEIGADDVPQLLVFNKIDISGHSERVSRSDDQEAQAVWVSAVTGAGIELLGEAISDRLAGQRAVGWMHLAPGQGRLRAQLYAASAILEEQTLDDGSLLVNIDIDAVDFARIAHEHRITGEPTSTPGLLAAAQRG